MRIHVPSFAVCPGCVRTFGVLGTVFWLGAAFAAQPEAPPDYILEDPAPSAAPAVRLASAPVQPLAPDPTPEPVAAPRAAAVPGPAAGAGTVAGPGVAVVDSIQAHTDGKRLYSFEAQGIELKLALAMFARANRLNIVPDNDVSGTVTLAVNDLPLELMMRALLEANDCSWAEDRGLIRIRSTETRTYQVDYLRLSRKGKGQSSATMASSAAPVAAAWAAAGAGWGRFDGRRRGGRGHGGAGGGQGSSISLEQDNEVDFWKEIKDELGLLLTSKGKETLAINMTAGIIQFTDRPSAHRRVDEYLDTLDDIVERQVDIEVRLFDVTLGDQFQWGVNWQQVAEIAKRTSPYLGTQSILVDTLAPQPGGGFKLLPDALNMTSQNAWLLGRDADGNAVSGTSAALKTDAVIQALKTQGEVRVISQPRVRVVNNQTALIKVATDVPFFSQTSAFFQDQGNTIQTTGDQITTITVGTILALTPQISSNGWITLDISPTLSSLADTVISPSKTATAPVIDIKQASTLVRVPDGTTIVLGGLIQEASSKTVRKVPLLGDIPILGYLFKGKTDAKQKKELVMFVTPRVVRSSGDAGFAAGPGAAIAR
ncbi:MAG: secretin N-terminal domain-containing protein [Verrucomicrobiales bacterium]|nr:secretin N-terminal domain-containing protein [Verrucomicrobiales bacterium]